MNKLILNQKKGLKQDKKKGFTLVELIIVIAIIAILAAMAIPKFSAVRIDAKVSNDVAAAKNIQTQIATAIANGTITGSVTEAAPVPLDILQKLDGPLGKSTAAGGKAEALPTGVFKYTIDAKENISVFVDTYQLYPETSTNGKSAYASAVK